MIHAWLTKTGAWIAGVVAFVAGALYIHKSTKREAVKDALELERQRIRTQTAVKKEQIKEEANEIDQAVGGADTDDLRDRMRSQATD